MNGPTPVLHLPAEVARMLRCSEWWVKEQARKRRIPFIWIGGYRFTDEHIAEIIALFEVRPDTTPVASSVLRQAAIRSGSESDGGTVVQLRARPTRRARKASSTKAA